MAFLKHVTELLEQNGESVDVAGLTPARTLVRHGGPDAAPVGVRGHLHEMNGDLPAAPGRRLPVWPTRMSLGRFRAG
jgi:hypothetical protein